MKPQKLKRAVIREEFVALTGDHISALILNQMLYWTERVADFDKFLIETQQRQENLEVDLQHGWIYKNAKELSEELMLGASHQTIRRYMQALIDAGFLQERHNPKNGWDRTMQYRVDIAAVIDGLDRLGYALEGYARMNKSHSPIVQNGHCIVQNGLSSVQNGHSSIYTEITTETKKNGATHRTPLFVHVDDEGEDETPTPDQPPAKDRTPPKKQPEPVDAEYFKAVSWVLGRNPETMTKASRLEVTQIVRKFKKQGYTLTQIKNWYLTFWKKDWRGKNGSKPTAKQFVNEFDPKQAKEITDVITSSDAHTEELPELDESVWDTTNLDF